MKKITVYFFSTAMALFLTFILFFSLPNKVLAITSISESSNSEISIPPDIGIEIPHAEPNVPIIGIAMWAIITVAIMTALIVIFSNLGNSDTTRDTLVHRKRYRTKKAPKSKLLGDKYYRK